jgi:hypothetical protein
MRAFQCLVVMLLLAEGATGRATAEEHSPPIMRQRVGLELGVASAVGIAGVDYQFAPSPWLRLEGGAGWGPTGAQFSIMPKIALGSGRCAFIAGFGPSLAVGGQQAAAGHGPNPGTIPWLNLDVPGIECHSRSGVSFQATVGLTMPLVDFHWDLADVGETTHAGALLPQGRVGVGWWF